MAKIREENVFEGKLEDVKVNDSRVDPDTEMKETVQSSSSGPRILAVVDDGKRSKLMLRELKDRGVKFTEQKADLKDVKKAVLDIVKDKKDSVDVVYLPVTNTDYNKKSAEFSQLRAEAGVTIAYYFDGHDDQEISNRCFRLKIE